MKISELLKLKGIELKDVFVTVDGKKVSDEEMLADKMYRINLRILGGKGGFGSMLRALGAQIEKTTNREACRDLSGRRMKDINNEKKLREWAEKQKNVEDDKEERKREKRERMLKEVKHKFEDKNYDDQKSKISDNLDDAVQCALVKQKKRKIEMKKKNLKKAKQTFGVDLSSDEESDEEDLTPRISKDGEGCSGESSNQNKSFLTNNTTSKKSTPPSSPPRSSSSPISASSITQRS